MKKTIFKDQSTKPTLAQKWKWFFYQQVEHATWIHKDIDSRKKFTRVNRIIILSIFLVYALAVGLFAGFGLKANWGQAVPGQGGGPNPFYLNNGDINGGVVAGLVIFIIIFIVSAFLACYIPILFRESQEIYTQTDEFKKSVKKYKDEKLLKSLSNRDLKIARKLNFIDKNTVLFYKQQNKKAK